MLSETSGDFVAVDEHPMRVPAAIKANTVIQDLSAVIRDPLMRF
jgi:hypothetical protein